MNKIGFVNTFRLFFNRWIFLWWDVSQLPPPITPRWLQTHLYSLVHRLWTQNKHVSLFLRVSHWTEHFSISYLFSSNSCCELQHFCSRSKLPIGADIPSLNGQHLHPRAFELTVKFSTCSVQSSLQIRSSHSAERTGADFTSVTFFALAGKRWKSSPNLTRQVTRRVSVETQDGHALHPVLLHRLHDGHGQSDELHDLHEE